LLLIGIHTRPINITSSIRQNQKFKILERKLFKMQSKLRRHDRDIQDFITQNNYKEQTTNLIKGNMKSQNIAKIEDLTLDLELDLEVDVVVESNIYFFFHLMIFSFCQNHFTTNTRWYIILFNLFFFLFTICK